jgi:alcohol dehydrogenase class IV
MKKDKDAIEKMSYAQYIAGMGFSNVGLGIVHSMAHQLGAVYDTPHGIANAMLLPVVMKFNGDVCADRFAEILEALGVETKGMTKKQKIDKFVSKAKIFTFVNSSTLGIIENTIGEKIALKNARAVVTMPNTFAFLVYSFNV